MHEKFRKYLAAERWYKDGGKQIIAYFSMEYGLDVSLPIYSGGLGVLSGDHLKSASDLGLPLVGVGLLYRQGYFQQYLNPDGFQLEVYPENDWYTMPVHPCRDPQGGAVKVSVDVGEAQVAAQVWEVRVGQTPLYLLDTNIEDNPPADRLITATLYGGDRDMRIRQEILLGVGGIRALQALGLDPAVTHMNEGHSAFLALERVRGLMREKGVSFEEAAQAVWPTSIFTTHTPVPAGNERFPPDLMARYFRRFAGELGLSWKDFLALGRENPDNEQESFCMTVLALRLSACANGVSQLHGQHLPPHVERAVAGAAGRGGADPGHHQRRAPAHLDLPRHDRPAGPLPGAALPGGAHQPGRLGPDREDLRRGAVPHPRAAPGAPGGLRPQPPAPAAQAPRHHRGGAGQRRGRPVPLHPDHLLRPAFRLLQAGQPPAARPGAPGAAAHRPAAPRAAHLRRQGPPPRPGGQGDHPRDHPLRPGPPGAHARSCSWRTTT